jgi:hypothetical protein
VAGERRLRILQLVVEGGTSEFETRRLCDVGAELTGTTGGGIMLMSGDLRRGSLCATNPVSTLIEEQQFALGEGPCMDAYHHDQPALEPDLADPRRVRWPAFAGPVIASGCRAVFAFPLRVGAVRIGALDLYRDRKGSLSDDQHADALVMADVAAEAVLALQAGAPPGQLAAELAAGGEFHPVVHQAAGMVAAQLETSVGQALVRLRAHAFGESRTLTEVAREVVGRTLRFDPLTHDGTEAP